MIELIVVIVILGILAATALPKFIDVSADAKDAALDGVAGAANSAMSINYGGCSITANVATDRKCVLIATCDEVNNILQGGTPAGYTVAATAIGTKAGDTIACTVTPDKPGNKATSTFTGIRTTP